MVEQCFRSSIDTHLDQWVSRDSPHYELTRQFALGRLAEGQQLASFFESCFIESSIRVLDLGAGNGGVSIGLANHARYQVTALDILVNEQLRELKTCTMVPTQQIVGSGHLLPFKGSSFDLVLCLETIEHVPDPRKLGREIMRILRPGGLCMITTPARIRHLAAPDPHYGVRGLLLLPDSLQRYMVTTFLRRSQTYDVEHVFWSRYGITRHFPNAARVETLINIPWPGIPRTPRQILWYLLRAFLWDRIIVHKRKL